MKIQSSLKQIMAAKCKMGSNSYISPIILSIVICFYTTGIDGTLKSSADRWLSNFDRATVLMETPGKVHQPSRFAGRLFLHSDTIVFNMTLYTSISTDHVLLNVDGESASFDASTLGIYEGSLSTPCCGYKAIVKVTTEGIDAFINTDNNKYIIEPWTRFDSGNNEFQQREPKTQNSADLKRREYDCILYTAKDVLNNNTKTSVANIDNIWKAESYDNSFHRVLRSIGMTECSIHIAADDTFYKEVGQSNVRSTLSELLYLVLESDLIFRGTDFDGDGAGDNIGFYVSKVSIYTSPNEHSMSQISTVYEYLETFSTYDHSAFCLAVAFTSRSFADGVVGLAWVASSSAYGAIGGICQRRMLLQTGMSSLNTALISTHNDGDRMPTYKSVITLTHEFGHNFGSPHDSTSDLSCSPNGDYGNFIMYPYASDGTKPNNKMFSLCSIGYMFPVIRNKAWCFKYGEDVRSVCGNGITEDGEDCDCGLSETCDDIDPCCTPKDVDWASTDTPCTVRASRGSECSPLSSPCCDNQCKITTSPLHQCRPEMDCTERATCDGASAKCPDRVSKLNGTECDRGTKTCETGACFGSICAIHGRVPCVCSGQYNCYVCCRAINQSECSPTLNHAGQFVFSHLGQSCNERQGYCDGQGKCISQDPGSALDRLHEVFNKDSIEGFKEWMKTYWYYVAACIAALIFSITVFVFTCRGEENVHMSAYMHGQFGRIQGEAEIQKQYLERRKAETKADFEEELQNFDCVNEMCITEAMTRMMTFFPTARGDVLMETLQSSASEEAAVRWMLLRNYPFRRVCSPREMKMKIQAPEESKN